MLIGLDCAEPSLVLERWRDELPTISGLMERGAYGRLTSVIPPITVPPGHDVLEDAEETSASTASESLRPYV